MQLWRRDDDDGSSSSCVAEQSLRNMIHSRVRAWPSFRFRHSIQYLRTYNDVPLSSSLRLFCCRLQTATGFPSFALLLPSEGNSLLALASSFSCSVSFTRTHTHSLSRYGWQRSGSASWFPGIIALSLSREDGKRGKQLSVYTRSSFSLSLHFATLD